MTISDERLAEIIAVEEQRIAFYETAAIEGRTMQMVEDRHAALTELRSFRTTADTEQDGKGVEAALRKAQAAIANCLTAGGVVMNGDAPAAWWDEIISAQQSIAAALSTLSSAPQQEAVAQWGDAKTVGNLIAQLKTLDPDVAVFGAFHAEYQGKHQPFVRGLTLSKERIEGRRFATGNADIPYSAVIWSAPQDNPTSPPPVDPAPSQDGVVTDEMVERAWTAFDAKAGYSRGERVRAALEAALNKGGE